MSSAMRPSSATTLTVGSALFLLAGLLPGEASCLRTVANKTPHTVLVSQDGGPAFTVRAHASRRLRYDRSGEIAVSVVCRAGGRFAAPQPPAFTARYAVVAVRDRCWVDIDGGGTAPLALNAPRQGDIVVARYGLACP
ncbi:hypothetical protein ASG40_07600 [Methylobacterium sp. Leaf399]|nr:hypothetical protein ASG40_07600 [Methylobacterium sp. Leaf399]